MPKANLLSISQFAFHTVKESFVVCSNAAPQCFICWLESPSRVPAVGASSIKTFDDLNPK
ncbi:hypothetical protein Sjap_013870 [Stephania japonica]|uniref:Uncharacterized protein n=1 Tax=Stephania japonica TaxID=461633 RepID=A0AAP0NZ09_9MAGN